jgi:sugar lactone lactonase YvrE
MSDEVFTIWRGAALLAEGPVWSVPEQALYFVDIKSRFVHRLKAETLEQTTWSSPYEIGCIAPRAAGGWICAHKKGIAFLDLSLRGKVSLTPVAAPEAHRPGNRFNDGKCDPQGRFWCGSMDDAEREVSGALYGVKPDATVFQADADYAVANGPTFSVDGRTMLANDSAKRLTYAFDLRDDGMPVNKRVWREHEAGGGYPDGMTTDAEGCVWIAFWGGSKIVRFDKDGLPMRTIAIPARQVTSVTFGGLRLDRLYITTAAIGLDKAALRDHPASGGVFAVEPGVKGLPPAAFAG